MPYRFEGCLFCLILYFNRCTLMWVILLFTKDLSRAHDLEIWNQIKNPPQKFLKNSPNTVGRADETTSYSRKVSLSGCVSQAEEKWTLDQCSFLPSGRKRCTKGKREKERDSRRGSAVITHLNIRIKSARKEKVYGQSSFSSSVFSSSV